jgi:hypothetical protein
VGERRLLKVLAHLLQQNSMEIAAVALLLLPLVSTSPRAGNSKG